MVAKLHPSFWSDPDVEQLDPEAKLACVWLITNSGTSILGLCKVSARRFTFETGLNAEALQRAIQGLPRALGRFGDTIFIKNFIRHQFGTGAQLTKNNIWKSILTQFHGLKQQEVQQAICSEYPEFGSPSRGNGSPSQALTKGFKAQGEGEGEGEGEGATEKGCGEKQPDPEPDPNLYEQRSAAPSVDQLTKAMGLARIVLAKLNQLTGAKYRETGDSMELIAVRLFETRYDLTGINAMVERQVKLWSGDPRTAQGLTPKKLFGENFGSYYGQRDLPINVDRNGRTNHRSEKAAREVAQPKIEVPDL